jgi:predicted Zn-dependent protease
MLGQAVGQGVGLLFLKYSRDDETQSDDLGLRYMSAAGYAPSEMPRVFHTLARQTQVQGGARAPEWQSTHPAPENREGRMQAEIAKLPPQSREGRVDAAPFLAQVDGIVYGADPRAGYFDGANVFHHPELALRVRFPKGWKTQNLPTAVVGVSPEQDAVLQLAMARGNDAEAAAAAFFANQGIQHGAFDAAPINGLAAVSAGFSASGQQGTVRGRTAFIEHGKHVYQIIGFSSSQGYVANEKLIGGAIRSFAKETDPKVLAVKPWRIEIVTPTRSLGIEEFAKVYPGPASAEDLAILNQIDPGERYAAGVPVKRIVGTSPP